MLPLPAHPATFVLIQGKGKNEGKTKITYWILTLMDNFHGFHQNMRPTHCLHN
jgi:hypothetical protein